jgi:hypothetical protein
MSYQVHILALFMLLKTDKQQLYLKDCMNI